MRTNSYRGFEFDCSVKGVKRGKASIKWNCVVHITAPGAKAHEDLETIVSAWSASGARAIGIKHAKTYVDEFLGPEDRCGTVPSRQCH
jgi:hypothetical protein